MTTSPIRGSRSIASAVLTAVVIAAELGLAAISYLGWTLNDNAKGVTFVLAGVSAVIGAALLVLVAVAFAGGSARLAGRAEGLMWLRLFGVLVTLTVFAFRPGWVAMAGAAAVVGAVIALADAAGGVVLARLALRRTSRV
ncbi:hypothetical protein [Paractinoplanes atraurantiacus]|uniref:Uncharacterized protein n=1 Tax=Paractinoplanes atraurantiacus TaxID=1036182 RepID=A0A285H1L0_9ACTN|nr:hypothetical protein [Actinoplanes atraurantiacus]SNY28391.1 hypothetical protein SAMN05421748_10374 [Actinoplanes atraurantiacus]